MTCSGDGNVSTVSADDAHCANCGYALRTLPPDGDCPECGFPVDFSLRRDIDREHLVREARIADRMTRYHRNRIGCFVLGVGHLLGLCVILLILPRLSTSDIFLMFILLSSLYGALFWFALGYAFEARYRHAQSICVHTGRSMHVKPIAMD